MAKYLGEQDADFNRPDQLRSNSSSIRRDAIDEQQSRRSDSDRDNGSNDTVDVDNFVDNKPEEDLTRHEAILMIVAQSLKTMFRVVLLLMISLFLMAFSSCYWYNEDSKIRSKIERHKKIVEVHPDFKVKWASFDEILLLKERHDYLRSAFPSQIVVGDQIDPGPIPKENTP